MKEREEVEITLKLERFTVDDKPCCTSLEYGSCAFLGDCWCEVASYTSDDDGMPRPNKDCPVWYSCNL